MSHCSPFALRMRLRFAPVVLRELHDVVEYELVDGADDVEVPAPRDVTGLQDGDTLRYHEAA
ncbi:MAG TPA: hypothetical protein VNJ04_13565 [Gemmatimonadaceae bacterium]|nr:hypothetical protein [Gemmatimonadaceae bacterium]